MKFKRRYLVTLECDFEPGQKPTPAGDLEREQKRLENDLCAPFVTAVESFYQSVSSDGTFRIQRVIDGKAQPHHARPWPIAALEVPRKEVAS